MSALPGFDTWLSATPEDPSICTVCELDLEPEVICEHGICRACLLPAQEAHQEDPSSTDPPCCLDLDTAHTEDACAGCRACCEWCGEIHDDETTAVHHVIARTEETIRC